MRANMRRVSVMFRLTCANQANFVFVGRRDKMVCEVLLRDRALMSGADNRLQHCKVFYCKFAPLTKGASKFFMASFEKYLDPPFFKLH